MVFFKQMSHHLVDLDHSFLDRCRNILLTRDPRDMLASPAIHLPDATLADTGLADQVRLLDRLIEGGEMPIVVDSRHLLDDPAGVLTAVCGALDPDLEPAMLSWPRGPRPEDGVWGDHWGAGGASPST
ncbi:MAG: hypothetical protein ACE5GB_00855 [Acidimicrobiales bacterium]